MTVVKSVLLGLIGFSASLHHHAHHHHHRAWRTDQASEFGAGDSGGSLACTGQQLDNSMVLVANKTLPCGTKVDFKADGRIVQASVEDRGPYARASNGQEREWDLSYALARKLRLIYPWSGAIEWHLA